MRKKQFKVTENEQRLEGLQKDPSEEKFLEMLNKHLSNMEPVDLLDPGHTQPIIFVIGVPRSGTTLLTQLVSSCFDVGSINNLIARFWLAPVSAIKLSKAVLSNQKNILYQSNYGKTSDITEPHEFSYFWHRWLKLEYMPEYEIEKMEKEIDWSGLILTLRNMALTFGKPLMLKAPLVLYYIDKIAAKMPEAIFVYSKRDLADVAVSLRKGRIKYYGDDSKWLGMYPLEYNKIKNLPPKEQLAAQIYYLDKSYRSKLNELQAEQGLVLEYKDICTNTQESLQKIKHNLFQQSSVSLRDSAAPPAGLIARNYSGTEEYLEFAAILNQLRESGV